MSLEYDKRFLWCIESPDDIDVQKYVGHHVKVLGPVGDPNPKEQVVEIERIMGSLWKPHYFQIDSKDRSFVISMVDFFAQMSGEKISESEVKLFNELVEETDFQVREPLLWTPNRRGTLLRQMSRNSSRKRRGR